MLQITTVHEKNFSQFVGWNKTSNTTVYSVSLKKDVASGSIFGYRRQYSPQFHIMSRLLN